MEQKFGSWEFVVVWQFQVRPGMVERFERVYGVDGNWVEFFRQDEAYIGTKLIRDLKAERTYLTLDFWRSEEAYEAFRAQHAAEYKAIDAECESMTESEREIRAKVTVPNRASR
jgi:quinol monooxygenase YgiN